MSWSLFAFAFVLALGARAIEEGAQEEQFVSVWPEKSVVEYGQSLVLNCTSNCGNIGLETSLRRITVGQGVTWKAFNLTSVNEWSPSPLCHARCDNDKAAKIIVYKIPDRVELDPVPVTEVGEAFNLTCRISDVAPIRNLTVTFRKGKENLHVKSFENYSAHKSSPVTVNYTLVAQEGNHGEEVTCHAVLDLSPEGPRIEKASPNQTLSTVVFQTNPFLQSLDFIETNTKMSVICRVLGIFPAEEAKFNLSFADQNLRLKNVTVSEGSVSAQTEVSFTSAGEHELICTVSLGPATRTVNKVVTVYSLPNPVLRIERTPILANQTVTFTCHSKGTVSPAPIMYLRKSNSNIEVVYGSALSHSLIAHEEDNGRLLTCRVELKIHGHSVFKEASVNLAVFYAPQMNESNCPSKLTWQDGTEETLTCSPWGNPKPVVECKKDEELYNIGVPLHVEKKHEGLYLCSATNAYGSNTREINIVVESYQPNTLAISLAVLAIVTAASMGGVFYYMYYKSHKIRKYRLKRLQRARGAPMEENCLNGNAPV
uniref:Ig-like domain-containing protein n=1 Tax=Salvator merianae TaxID=96440 RepID=A0A8D0DTH7_SALMN